VSHELLDNNYADGTTAAARHWLCQNLKRSN
jgi:hypothetical protein